MSTMVTQTALQAGYKFVPGVPSADPRYPADQQLMVGPITMGSSSWEHDVFHRGLRNGFQARGKLAFMHLHKVLTFHQPSSIPFLNFFYFQKSINESGHFVKYGYVVYEMKGVAQVVEREGFIVYQGQMINVQRMT